MSGAELRDGLTDGDEADDDDDDVIDDVDDDAEDDDAEGEEGVEGGRRDGTLIKLLSWLYGYVKEENKNNLKTVKFYLRLPYKVYSLFQSLVNLPSLKKSPWGKFKPNKISIF